MNRSDFPKGMERNMPKALEAKLKKEAKRKGLSKKRTGAYVYGTLYKLEHKGKRYS